MPLTETAPAGAAAMDTAMDTVMAMATDINVTAATAGTARKRKRIHIHIMETMETQKKVPRINMAVLLRSRGGDDR